MRLNDAVFGVLLLLFSGAMIAYTRTFPATHGLRFGPDLFPILIGIGLATCGLVLVIRGVAGRKDQPLVQLGAWARDRRNVANFVLVLASLLFYILASDVLGFIPTALVVLVLLLVRFGVGLLAALCIGAAATLVIHTLFARFLLVPLPWGLLEPVAW
jgi:putative tricarboxylic transport membrane protein